MVLRFVNILQTIASYHLQTGLLKRLYLYNGCFILANIFLQVTRKMKQPFWHLKCSEILFNYPHSSPVKLDGVKGTEDGQNCSSSQIHASDSMFETAGDWFHIRVQSIEENQKNECAADPWGPKKPYNCLLASSRTPATALSSRRLMRARPAEAARLLAADLGLREGRRWRALSACRIPLAIHIFS
jgi:hypothetical protein